MLCVYPPPYFWILHIDGSAKPNPGHMSVGAVLTGPDGSRHTLGLPLPGLGCNNEAELCALLEGLQLALRQGAQQLRIYTDSHWLLEQLAQPQLLGTHIRATQRLADWLHTVRAVMAHFEQLQWRWIPRHCNAEADALARQAREAADAEMQKSQLSGLAT